MTKFFAGLMLFLAAMLPAAGADLIVKCDEVACTYETKIPGDANVDEGMQQHFFHRCKTHLKDCSKVKGLEGWSEASIKINPLAGMTAEERDRSAQYEIPEKMKAKIDQRVDELAKFRVGLGNFQHLYQAMPPLGDWVGSGMDYGELVMEGMLSTKLFTEEQVLLASHPDGAWDYFVSAIHVGGHTQGGVRYAINHRRKQKLVEDKTLGLPASWDRMSGYRPEMGRPQNDPRASTMVKFGKYLAYRVAGHMLRVVKGSEEGQ